MSDHSIVWHNATDLDIEGKGWADTLSPFDRLPPPAEQMVREPVWRMSHDPTGMCVRFRTNASTIHARWTLLKPELGEANFNRCTDSGLDLYGDNNGQWRWVATTHLFDGQDPEVCIVDSLDGDERDYLLYLPLRNPIERLEVGVSQDARFSALPPRRAKPLVFYGTSIVHGAYASRCGLVYPAILGRRLQRPVINLGFSGNAHMERELAELMGELDPAVYIIDALPNMNMERIENNVEPFLRRLRELKPDAPFVLVEQPPRTHSWAIPSFAREIAEKCGRYHEIVDALEADGMQGIHYVEGQDLLGHDGEAALDGLHPGDLGYMRMADALTPLLTGLCQAD